MHHTETTEPPSERLFTEAEVEAIVQQESAIVATRERDVSRAVVGGTLAVMGGTARQVERLGRASVQLTKAVESQLPPQARLGRSLSVIPTQSHIKKIYKEMGRLRVLEPICAAHRCGLAGTGRPLSRFAHRVVCAR